MWSYSPQAASLNDFTNSWLTKAETAEEDPNCYEECQQGLNMLN
jgi:hypothetical protein